MSDKKPKNPVAASAQVGSYRVLRGGLWFNSPSYLKAAYRYDSNPSYRDFNYGFRIARTAKK